MSNITNTHNDIVENILCVLPQNVVQASAQATLNSSVFVRVADTGQQGRPSLICNQGNGFICLLPILLPDTEVLFTFTFTFSDGVAGPAWKRTMGRPAGKSASQSPPLHWEGLVRQPSHARGGHFSRDRGGRAMPFLTWKGAHQGCSASKVHNHMQPARQAGRRSWDALVKRVTTEQSQQHTLRMVSI